MGGEVMMVLVYVTGQALCKPSRALYHLMMCVVNVYFTIVIKLVLHNPRPYMMVGDSIKVISSSGAISSEFGDPSGHTMSSSQVIVSVFLDYMAQKDEEDKKITKNCYQNKGRRWARYAIFLIVFTFTVLIVGYSRMFNGVHSLDQVITGALLGVWQGIIGHYVIRPRLYSHVDGL